METLFIRADGNSRIGTGHIMRCIEIARQYLKYGGKVSFVVADVESKKLLAAKGYESICLNSIWDELSSETEKMVKCIDENQIHLLLVDSYFVTEDYLMKIREKTKVAYIDDLHEQIYPCDLLINDTIFADRYNYEAQYKAIGTKLCLGCQYLPLREEFENVPHHTIKKQAKNILVMSGGTDPNHFLLHFLEYMPDEEKEKYIFNIVCGIYNNDYTKLAQMENENVHVFHNVETMKELMYDADLAISAGGGTLYELCACGTPAITYSMADNQLENVREFDRRGIFPCTGDLRMDYDYQFLYAKIHELAQNKEKRELMSINARKLTDGFGAKRIVKEFINLKRDV